MDLQRTTNNNNLVSLPYPCWTKIISHLDTSDFYSLMETCHQLRHRMKEEIIPSINSISLCFYRRQYVYPKLNGSTVFDFYIPDADTWNRYISQNESIHKLLLKRHREVEIIIVSGCMDQMRTIQNFLRTISIDAKNVTIRFKSLDWFRGNTTYDFFPFFGIQTFKSIEHLTFDIDASFYDIGDFIKRSIDEASRFQLRSFGLFVDTFQPNMKDNFENFCKLQPNCKIQLGFRYYATEFGYMIIEMKPFVYSSNITVLDLFKYDNRINWNKMGMKMNIERINQFIRYAPNVHTLKIILRDCSPIDWSQLLKRMSLLTKLEIICWYDEKLWPKNFCTTMPNIRHLTLFITKESHDQVLKLLSIIKFPSLQTFTLRPVNTRWTECRKCFHSKQPQDRCVRYVYVELVKHSTDLKAFFAFKREWSIIFLNEN